MKLLIVLAFVALAAARPEDGYSRYDNFNMDEIITNLRLLKAYCKCFLEVGKCTPAGTDFKKWIPESVQSSCGKCSDKQKADVAKFIITIQEQLPEEWEKLIKVYDPEGTHGANLKEFLQKYAH